MKGSPPNILPRVGVYRTDEQHLYTPMVASVTVPTARAIRLADPYGKYCTVRPGFIVSLPRDEWSGPVLFCLGLKYECPHAGGDRHLSPAETMRRLAQLLEREGATEIDNEDGSSWVTEEEFRAAAKEVRRLGDSLIGFYAT